jgi:cytochrome b involved in lipid metabolism
MKKLTYSLFIAFWASIATLAVLHGMDRQDKAADGQEELPVYTLDEVAEHDSLDSCWKVIEGKVYDFTDYIPDHPTRPGVMLRWCGRESTEAMRTKGFGEDHSPRAWAMMEDYLIGRLSDED